MPVWGCGVSPRAGLDREAVVEAAASLVDEEGLDGLTVGRLAERLGVRAPSLYNHIAGLEELKRAVAALGVERLAGSLMRAAVGKSGEQAVFAIADAYRAFAREHPDLYAATLRAPEPGDGRYSSAAGEILEIVGAALEPYRLGSEDRLDAVRGLRSLCHGFVSLELCGGFGMPREVDRSFEQAVRTYLTGLACAGRESGFGKAD
jgi:AcrR family transcriptional regulator